MGACMINDGAGRFNVRDDRNMIVARNVSLAAAIELVHRGCRLCEAGQDHMGAAVRLDRRKAEVVG